MSVDGIKRRPIIGVMGGGEGDSRTLEMAAELGALIAARDWVLLNGGRNAGVMAPSTRGAAEAGGLTVGILPDSDVAGAAPHIHIPIPTGMGSARNHINVLAAEVVIACPGGPGTISEVALALKSAKPVICLGWDPGPLFESFRSGGLLQTAAAPEEAVLLAASRLS